MSATLQEIEEAPPGSKVLVEGIEWEKVEQGLRRDGTVLGLMHFTTYLNAGQVTWGQWWQVGRWYRSDNDYALVTHRHEQQVHVLFYPLNAVSATEAEWPEVPPPPGMTLVATEAEGLWMKRVRALHTELIREVPQPIVEALHGYARMVDDDGFDSLLDEQGIGRERGHDSNVLITGTSYWTPDAAAAARALGANVEITEVEDSVTVYWRKYVNITNEGLGCTCDTIDRDALVPYLPEDTASFEFEVECT